MNKKPFKFMSVYFQTKLFIITLNYPDLYGETFNKAYQSHSSVVGLPVLGSTYLGQLLLKRFIIFLIF